MQKQEQIKKQIASELAKQKTLEKKNDTRRKILVGAYFLEKTNPDDIKRYMGAFLTRPADRALFGLDEKQTIITKPAETHESIE
ncbi:MAG: mobilization protein [Bacteroidetes bacterium]|nr:mobilization protein [Bacteroidota bacterium]